MKTTDEALQSWDRDQFGHVISFPEEGIEVRLEPLLFDGQYYLAVYKNLELVREKIVIKKGYVKEENE